MDSSKRPWFRLWAAVLVAMLAFVIWDAAGRIRHVGQVSSVYGVMVDPPAADPASPTGYVRGRRSLVLPVEGDDGLQWIMQTQAMFARGVARLHFVDYDNAPAGREAHWAVPFHWWLAGIAWVDHAVSGRPIGLSVERAALLAGPVLHGLLLLGLVPLVARRFGALPASLLAVGLAMAYPFNLYFAADYPDHHGMLEACGVSTVLFLLAGGSGCIRVEGEGSAPARGEPGLIAWLPVRRAARRWFVASAVAGGLGLWISAASQVPVLVGVGLGATAVAWWCRGVRPSEGWGLEPTLWRLWGIIGGVTSVAGYLIEYFPFELGWRLEVNHPLYALAWLGGGELLCRITRLLSGESSGRNRRDLQAALWAGAAVMVLPVVILLTKERTFLVASRFVWSLGTEYVGEGRSLVSSFRGMGSNLEAWGRCLPLLAIILPFLVVGRRNLSRGWKAQLVMALAPALLLFMLTVTEIRWWGVECGLLLVVLAVLLVVLQRSSTPPGTIKVWALACALLFVPGAVSAIRPAMAERPFTQNDLRHLAERDLAHWLGKRMGATPVVIASTPATTNHLIYYGGFKGLGTLYWENVEGFKHAAELFSAASPERAYELVRQYGVTHIALVSWDGFEENFVRFYRGLTSAQPTPADAFILGLLHGKGVPLWLRLIPVRLAEHEALKEQNVFLFEVTPAQLPEARAVQMTDYLMQMGRQELAGFMEPELEQSSGYFPALVMLAYFQGKTGHAQKFSATLGRILVRLPAPTGLELEDRIRLAIVLWVGGQTDLAREQYRVCLDKLDEPSLCRLTPGSLTNFLKLGAALGEEIRDPGLRRLAAELQPLYLRETP
jgi:hypothetical protein